MIPGQRLNRSGLTIAVGNVLKMKVDAVPRASGAAWFWRVTWIDRTREHGDIHSRRTAALSELAADGVIDPHTLADFRFTEPWQVSSWPTVMRLIVLTSDETNAGWGDFQGRLPAQWPVKTEVRYITRPGAPMADGCIDQLATITAGEADFVFLVRGGGGIGDLRPFDNPDLARAIHRCPVKVVTAVGHRKDVCVADRAAFAPFPVPGIAAEAVSRAYYRQRKTPRTKPPAQTTTAATASSRWVPVPTWLTQERTEHQRLQLQLANHARELDTTRTNYGNLWRFTDHHLLTAAADRTRRRSIRLTASTVAVAAFVGFAAFKTAGSQAALVLAAAAILSLAAATYIAFGPRRATRPAGPRLATRKANTNDEWVTRMCKTNKPRELRALRQFRPFT